MAARRGERIARFAARHRGHLARAALREAGARLAAKPALRRAATAVRPPRAPRHWAFVVGCYNSGTTLLRELIGAHPLAATLPREGVVLTDAFPDLEAGGWARMMLPAKPDWGAPREGAAARAMRDWAPHWHARAEVFVEKSIAHATRLPWIEEAFGAPRIVVTRRDPLCACEGVLRRAAPSGEAADRVGARYPAALVAAQWRALDDAIRDAAPRLTHVHETSYERLVAAPAREMGAIFAFLGLPDPGIAERDGELRIGARRFEIRDMNPESRARLSPFDRASIEAVLAAPHV